MIEILAPFLLESEHGVFDICSCTKPAAMNNNHKEQIAFLKKKIDLGFRGNDLFAVFKEKFKLSKRTFEERAATARLQMGTGGGRPVNWVLLNFEHSAGAGENTAADATAKVLQQTASATPQQTTEAELKNYRSERTEKVPQQNAEKVPQQKVLRPTMVTAAQEVTAAAENLLCMEVLSVEECLLMLSRFAMGQYVRARHFSCGGEVVEVQETPPFTARRSAVMAILKYHEAVAKAAGTPEWDDPSRYVTMSTEELFNMSTERIGEFSLELHRRREEIQNKR